MANMFLTPADYDALPGLRLDHVRPGDQLVVSGDLSLAVDVDGECFTPWMVLPVEQDEAGLFISCCSGRYRFAERAGEDGVLDGLKQWLSEAQKAAAAAHAAPDDPVQLMREIRERQERLEALLAAQTGS